nr:PREDICTED: embigin [Apteryx mantelli mantelli]
MTTEDASQTQGNLTQMPTRLNESSTEPMTTTRIVNRQTRESISDHSPVGHGVSTPGSTNCISINVNIAINDSLMSDKYVIDRVPANTTHLKILKLTKKDDGAYWCEAVFKLGKSKGKLKLKVLTFMVPLKPFLVILAEVIILVAIVFLYEVYSKKKEKHAEDEKEFEQVEQLKSEESNGVESSSTRHRKV